MPEMSNRNQVLAGKYMPEVLAHYVEVAGSAIELDDPDFGVSSAVSDLLVDLMHVCAALGIDFDDRLEGARSVYGEEMAGIH